MDVKRMRGFEVFGLLLENLKEGETLGKGRIASRTLTPKTKSMGNIRRRSKFH